MAPLQGHWRCVITKRGVIHGAPGFATNCPDSLAMRVLRCSGQMWKRKDWVPVGARFGDKNMIDFAARRTMMVDTQVRPSDVTKLPIIDALLAVGRELYVPDSVREAAYVGEHIPLGAERVILDPRIFAKMLDALNVESDDLVLDIGCGLGYSAAVLGHLAQAVVAVEDEEDRAREAESILSDDGVDNVAVITGPLAEGASKHAPFDAIIIEGGVGALPNTLIDQLADGGRIACIFQDGALGTVRIGYKIEGKMSWRDAFNAAAPVLSGFERHTDFVL